MPSRPRRPPRPRRAPTPPRVKAAQLPEVAALPDFNSLANALEGVSRHGGRPASPRGSGVVRTSTSTTRAGSAVTVREDSPHASGQQSGMAARFEQLVRASQHGLTPRAEATVSDWAVYAPTATTDPMRPRTLEMRYSRSQQVLEVTFRDGGTYQYQGVAPNLWRNVKRVRSPGKWIDRTVKGAFPYTKVG